MANVYESVTPDILKEFDRIEEIVGRDKVAIHNLQFMFGKDGMPVISDPMGAASTVKHVDAKGLDNTLFTIKDHKRMVEEVLRKKESI